MDIAEHPARVPVFRLLAIGTAVAFAFLLLALLLGFGSSQARADDGSDRGGLLGGVTNVVDDTVEGVTGVVQSTTQAVTASVEQVVRSAPAPVQAVVDPVVNTVANAAETVVQPVAEATDTGVVGSVVTPVVEVVTAVPVVGGVVHEVGLDDAVTDVASTADTAANTLVTTVGDTATGIGGTRPPLVDIPDIEPPLGAPGTPSVPSLGSLDEDLPAALAALSTTDQPFASWTVAAVSSAYAHVLPAFTAITAMGAAAAGFIPAGVQMGGILSSALVLGVCAPGGSSPLGSSGAGPGALALAAFAPLLAYRAWVRRSGWSDDVAPAAPTYDTDVSPD